MNNLKVRTKISIIVAVSVLAIFIVALFGIWQVHRMSASVDEMTAQNSALQTRLTRMVEAFGVVRMYVRDSVLAVSDEHRMAYIAAIGPLYERLVIDTDEYLRILIDNGMQDTEEYRIARDIADSLPAAATIIRNITDMALRGEIAEAAYQIESVCVPHNDAIGAELARLAYINEARADAALARSAGIRAGSVWVSVAIALAAIAVLLVLGIIVRNNISTPLEGMMLNMRDLAIGELNVRHQAVRRDEIGQLAADVYSLSSVIRSLMSDFMELERQVNAEGNISYRMDPEIYLGVFREFCERGNALVENANHDMSLVFEVLEAIGDGDFDISVKQLPGEKAAINQHFDVIVNSLREIHGEIAHLFHNAAQGILDVYADEHKYKGDWGKLIREMNNLLGTVADPIAEIEISLAEMAMGNFNTPVKGDYRGAFDMLKQTVNSTGEQLINNVDEITKILIAFANGDLTVPIDRAYIGSYRPIKEALISILKSLNHSLWEVQGIAAKVQEGSEQMAQNVMTLASGATRQSEAIKILNESVESINEKTRLSAERAKTANERSLLSTDSAKSGTANMQAMITTIESIKASSANITKIIELLQNIAFQTNLLALNASVEAARAGEHGKGFAVVADEVRNLATRSQTATKSSIAEIEDSLRKIDDGINVASGTADSLNTIAAHVAEVSSLVEQISAMAQEQADAIDQIYLGVNDISQTIETSSATTLECSLASQELSRQAEMLKKSVSVFKVRPPREIFLKMQEAARKQAEAGAAINI
ncbi:MAG: methyl-accepting chemotaxis protein [Defluviitaleaceae bacterium]|nr:methyl-accepting chemotaxis protein [Defluviitaleaceae bacterium]